MAQLVVYGELNLGSGFESMSWGYTITRRPADHSQKTCFACQGQGRIAANCPRQQTQRQPPITPTSTSVHEKFFHCVCHDRLTADGVYVSVDQLCDASGRLAKRKANRKKKKKKTIIFYQIFQIRCSQLSQLLLEALHQRPIQAVPVRSQKARGVGV
jgi:hypothetical protein